MWIKEEKMKEKLAINGGIPIRRQPFPCRIMFNKEEGRVVTKLIEKASYETTVSALDRYVDEETEVDTLNTSRRPRRLAAW